MKITKRLFDALRGDGAVLCTHGGPITVLTTFMPKTAFYLRQANIGAPRRARRDQELLRDAAKIPRAAMYETWMGMGVNRKG